MVSSGAVVAAHGRRFQVELAGGEVVNCVTRGRRSDIACGDRVDIAPTAPGAGVIEAIRPRTSLLFRSDTYREKLLAANVTQVLVVIAPEPPYHRELIDRSLAAAHAAGINALVVINKIDLPAASKTLSELSLYRSLGYELLPISARLDPAPLFARLRGHASVLVGQSGMGKSTLINGLIPDVAARVGAISTALGSGRHTTTSARLYRLDADSHIIDTPGLQAFGLRHVGAEQLPQCFVEFLPFLGQCRFSNCRHMAEPDCAISTAAGRGEIDARRLESYRTLIREMTAARRH